MIIGVTGFMTSGKGKVTEILARDYGFKRLAYGDEVRIEAKKLELNEERKTLQKLGDEMRIKYGVDYWSERIYDKMIPGELCVVDGMRYVEDAQFFRSKDNFSLIGVYASFFTRALRTIERTRNRQEDELTIDQFKIADANDRFGKSGAGQQTQSCFDISDFVLDNEGTLEKLNSQVYDILGKLK